MTASDNLGPQFYHASYEDHPEGTVLHGNMGGNYPEEERWRSSRVWMACSPEHAAEWSDGGANVYHVSPIHEPELHTDTNDFDYNANVSAGAVFNQYHTSKAKILRKLKDF